MRIALVAPVAQPVPPPRSGSIEIVTSLLADGLVRRGHDVTLFATGGSRTAAALHATFPRGYSEDASLWSWELCELFNVAAAVERASRFDLIHYQAEYMPLSLAFTRLSPVPLLQTPHYTPGGAEVAFWSTYAEAPFVAVSRFQARALHGLRVVATIHHGLDIASFPGRGTPGDYLLFLGRFTEGKGVLQAVEVARRTGQRLVLAAAETEYYRSVVAPYVDGQQVVYAGEVVGEAKAALIAGARALLYPLRNAEAFGLVLVEAAACGTPVAALDRGAVEEIVEPGVTGGVFQSMDDLVAGLPGVLALDRAAIRSRALERFGADRMVDEYVAAYSAVIGRA